jgi:hypothetical protein
MPSADVTTPNSLGSPSALRNEAEAAVLRACP